MLTTQVIKGRTQKTVTVRGIADETDREIAAFAASSAGETIGESGSLFGWKVLMDDPHDQTVAVVILHTD